MLTIAQKIQKDILRNVRNRQIVCLVLLFRGERISTEMSLVWLTISEALEEFIVMVKVRNRGQGWLKLWVSALVVIMCKREKGWTEAMLRG